MDIQGQEEARLSWAQNDNAKSEDSFILPCIFHLPSTWFNKEVLALEIKFKFQI